MIHNDKEFHPSDVLGPISNELATLAVLVGTIGAAMIGVVAWGLSRYDRKDRDQQEANPGEDFARINGNLLE